MTYRRRVILWNILAYVGIPVLLVVNITLALVHARPMVPELVGGVMSVGGPIGILLAVRRRLTHEAPSDDDA